MKHRLPTLTAAASLALLAGAAQAQTTGVSHPPEGPITTSAPADNAYANQPQPIAPPPADASIAPAPAAATTYSNTYTPYQPASSDPTLQTHAQTPQADAAALEEQTPVVDPNNINSGIVTSVPAAPNEIPIGTLVHIVLDQQLGTATAYVGKPFSAHLTQPIMRNGSVMIPQGSLIQGRVADVRTGSWLGPGPMLRLQPDFVVLPDGTRYRFSAEIIDLDQTQTVADNTHIGEEGQIVNNSHLKARLAGLSLTTGGAAAAGAMIGGGVGALIGAGIGAGAGAIWWARQDHQQVLPEGTRFIMQMDQPLFVGGTTD